MPKVVLKQGSTAGKEEIFVQEGDIIITGSFYYLAARINSGNDGNGLIGISGQANRYSDVPLVFPASMETIRTYVCDSGAKVIKKGKFILSLEY